MLKNYESFITERMRFRVKQGLNLIEVFDEDTDDLNMGSCTDCILGKVYGNYFDGLHELGLEEGFGEEYGFDIAAADIAFVRAFLPADSPVFVHNALYKILNKVWKEEVLCNSMNHS